MSKYTTEVRFICESLTGHDESVGFNEIDTIIQDAIPLIFSFDFPIFDEEYRNVLCTKILRHYYTREIGLESYGLWKLKLQTKLNEIMPYFNKLYESELISISPLVNNRYSVTGNKTKTGSDSTTGTSSSLENATGGSTNIRTGGYTDTNNLTDTLTKTGNNIVTDVKSGNETLEKVGKENETKTGEITTSEKGKIIDTRTGKGETTERYKGKGGLITDNTTDLFTDTPQGNIQNMGDDYGTSENPSDVPIVGLDTSYLTTAEKTLNSREDKSEWEKGYGFGKDASGNDFEDVRTRQFGEQPEQGEYQPYTKKENYGQNGVKIEKSFENRKDTRTYNNVTNNETTTHNTTDTETKTGTVARVYNSMTDTYSSTANKGIQGTSNKSITYGGIDDYTESVIGSKGISDSKLLKEFRETFLNIDEMIIKRLSDLFIYLW